jgi:F-type H+-transporting ATPase subunit b
MFASPYFWIAVAFIAFVALVVKTGGVQILAGLDARANRIRQELEQASNLREEAQAALAQYQRKQRDALKEAESIIAAAREEAKRISRQAAEELTATLARREAQALEKIAQAEAQAVKQVRDLAVDLALEATERLLIQNLDPQRADRLVDTAINELAGKLH